MKKIGRQVHFIGTSDGNPRNGEGSFLVAYYHSNNSGCCLNSTKIIKIMYDEIV